MRGYESGGYIRKITVFIGLTLGTEDRIKHQEDDVRMDCIEERVESETMEETEYVVEEIGKRELGP